MNKIITIIIIALVIITSGYFFFGKNGPQKESATESPTTTTPELGSPSVSEETIIEENEGGELLDRSVGSLSIIREINMISGNLFFNPEDLKLVKGEPVKISFENRGTHTFTIDELGVNVILRGSSGVAEFTPTKSGTFEYYCAVPGHREGGMFGSLLVE